MIKYYKYSKYSDEICSAICNCQMYFSYPIYFNDPYDMSFKVTFSAGISQYKKAIESETDNDETEVLSAIVSSLENGSESELQDRIEKRIKSRLGVCCLSKQHDSILMFSHYSCNHTGLCLGFDAATLKKHFGDVYDVNYTDRFPQTEYINLTSDSEYVSFYTSKATYWKYEKEVRILENYNSQIHKEVNNRGFLVKYHQDALREVIFGCRFDTSIIEKIKKCISKRNTHASFKIAVMNDDCYALNFRDI